MDKPERQAKAAARLMDTFANLESAVSSKTDSPGAFFMFR
jgi:hypothetical protein